ncbi:MAG: peptide/nickel transport system substrate-binding protein [Hyphomicrobiales bacterium]|jgi:peptide/nickel transport system substrate-binding protein|nr:peptide/nickel transport system substrate-binding protein [Hyphomicrobiales bacterium]
MASRWKHLAAALTLGALLCTPAAAKTLRAAMHSDLKIVDPIWTTALITVNHGYMIYDTLFALDEQLAVKPQMVDRHETSADKLIWTFTLRDGLEWHDGAPVKADDCVASLKRWGARDAMGQKLMSFVAELAAPDAKTIRMTLKEPYGLVLQTLAKPGANVPFMMPKRVADTDPSKQITDYTGSGPFIFKADEWRAGEKAVYLKNTKYKPRAEPASGLSGGKVAKVDRVEWIWIADPQTQMNALINGEIDFLEAPPHDLLPLIAEDKNIELFVYNRAGRQNALRFNTLHKPFDNPKIRLAVAYALNQKDLLEAVIGNSRWYVECKSLFPCGSPFQSTKGWDDKFGSDFASARALLQEAGYDGTPVVLMQSTDISSLSNLAPVTKSLMEKAGFKVDLQAMDWQTLVSRRTKKDPPNAGGWSAFLTSWSSLEIMDPVATSFLNASCEKATFGWPCDAEMEKLRDAFSKETDPGKQKAIAEAVQLRALDYPTHLQLGQYVQPQAFRKNVVGLLAAGSLAMWNIEVK